MKINRVSKYVCFLVLLHFISLYSNSQIVVETELKSLFSRHKEVTPDFSKPLKNAVGELDIVFSTSFLMYKSLISSQDKPSCIFTPSCSEFAVEAFQKQGLLTGYFKTFDRLSRCHGFANHNHYHFDAEKKLFYDPVK